jgi:hypothetical protein
MNRVKQVTFEGGCKGDDIGLATIHPKLWFSSGWKVFKHKMWHKVWSLYSLNTRYMHKISLIKQHFIRLNLHTFPGLLSGHRHCNLNPRLIYHCLFLSWDTALMVPP